MAAAAACKRAMSWAEKTLHSPVHGCHTIWIHLAPGFESGLTRKASISSPGLVEPSRALGLPGGVFPQCQDSTRSLWEYHNNHVGVTRVVLSVGVFLGYTQKNVNFDIRMDGHIIDCIYMHLIICTKLLYNIYVQNRTDMYLCILIVLWGSTEINCKYRVSRELCKGIILEGSSSARRSLSRVCVLTHSSTCSA